MFVLSKYRLLFGTVAYVVIGCIEEGTKIISMAVRCFFCVMFFRRNYHRFFKLFYVWSLLLIDVDNDMFCRSICT